MGGQREQLPGISVGGHNLAVILLHPGGCHAVPLRWRPWSIVSTPGPTGTADVTLLSPPRPTPGRVVTRRAGRRGVAWLALLALPMLALSCLSGLAATQPPPDADQHWAFQSPRDQTPPAVTQPDWATTSIDRFILAKLEAEGLSPASQADARTLIRRMSLDLTGLPPTYDEVRQFEVAVKQNRPVAISQLLERLLASPRYGERWGRHWLDVARYSDTKGYVYGREERRFVHAPAYRDWVIRAFNEDLPYDRFLLLQIAADQVVPAHSPDLAALGFITGGRRFLGVTPDIIDDRIDVLTRGTLGLTVACARCHDHKYDPIPTQDYYSLYGIFHGADERLVQLAKPVDADLTGKQQKYQEKLAQRRAEANARLRSRVGDYLAAQLELNNYPEEEFSQILGAQDIIPFSVRRWRDYLRQTQAEAPAQPIFAPWHALMALKDVPDTDFTKAAAGALVPVLGRAELNAEVAREFAQPVASLKEAAARYGSLFKKVDAQWTAALAAAESRKVTRPERLEDPAAEALRRLLHDPEGPVVVPDVGLVATEFAYPTSVTEELWRLQGDVERRLMELGTSAALVLVDRPPEPNPRVFVRGRASRLAEEVPRQFIRVISGAKREPFRQGSGRLELAHAIARAENPLTARVMVNRVWRHHFGSGLVKTPSDFGLRAERPSHPELLDWLARRFVADGWSVKKLHRLILSSAVYQQSSFIHDATATATLARVDPDNRLIAHFPSHRLQFEQLRDALLAAGGRLDLSMGGKPVDLLNASNTRRTVYAFVDRQFLPGVFHTFDFANPDIHVAVRHETTVPQQALFFLNGSFVAQGAQALARRFSQEAPEARIQQFYQALYQRRATSGEIAAALHFVTAAEVDQPPPPAAVRPTAWQYGVGSYDESAQRLKAFMDLPHFTGDAWQGAASFPGGETGWAQLTAVGGHPGNSRAHACIRRWVAPSNATVNIAGTLQHEPEPGDGIRAFIVSSRHGELKAATVHHSKAEMSVSNIVVQAGDTLDFIVDIGGTLSYDQFLWAPVITSDGAKWEARTEFNGPASPPPLLTPWEQYAQVLLLANEFAFVD